MSLSSLFFQLLLIPVFREIPWTRKPADLKEEDYDAFYKELYPFGEDPLFHIHLNVDYPFNLTGILYFPKIKNNIDIQRNKIQLYCNQVFVTDHAEPILAEVPKYCDEYTETHRLIKFLNYFIAIHDREIPPTSLLREFVGGSSFRY